MGKDKAQRAAEGKQGFLVAHNEAVGIVVRLSCTVGVFQTAFLVLREIASVYARRIGTVCKLPIDFFKPKGKLARCSVCRTVILHAVDEEQRQHLNPQRIQPFFLRQMLPYRLADLVFHDFISHRIAVSAARNGFTA